MKKRLLLVLAGALILGMFGPVPSASAKWWPFGRHSKKNAAGETAPAGKKGKKSKVRREKGRNGSDPLYTTPKSVGWWHKGPGPAGAGS